VATREQIASDIGSITGAATAQSGGPPCGAGVIGGMSILKFGKSLPLVELFETFMIIGMVLVAVAASSYFTFHHIASILKNEGGSPSSVNIANAAAGSQPVWIAIGIVIFVIGIVLYYVHRKLINTPT
jgi:hypothetical protein